MKISFMLLLAFVAFVSAGSAWASKDGSYSSRLSARMSPNDYLMRSHGEHRDPVFDKFKVVNVGATVGVGSDCGKINFQSTIQSSLQNVLDLKYFGEVGMGIIGAGPMLATCYLSPTWCAILKHSQLSANFLSQMRLNQCSIVDKYVDSRVEDYYQERQSCVKKAIQNKGGNLESAMDSCNSGDDFSRNLTSWSGDGGGGASNDTNRLIGSSAKWAGLDQPANQGALNLVKSFVGDTVLTKGKVSVDFGPRQVALTPRTYLQSLQKSSYEGLCEKIIKRIEGAGPEASVDRLVSDGELKNLSPNSDEPMIDRQTIRALALMPPNQRHLSCRKLSDSLANHMFSADVNRSVDLLTTLSQNPNLPPHRKKELEEKRQALKDSVEVTLALQKEQNDPVNQIQAQIIEQGQRLERQGVETVLDHDAEASQVDRVRARYMDCSDETFCEGR
ncbi:hypothetical protein WDW86_05075 [Bdellovibrionota bacterium FG-2]